MPATTQHTRAPGSGRPSLFTGMLRELIRVEGSPVILARRLGSSVRTMQRWQQRIEAAEDGGTWLPSNAVRLLLKQICEEHGVAFDARFAPDEAAVDAGKVGGRIRRSRERAGLTQAELAKKLRTTQSRLSDIERGVVVAPDTFVAAALKACGV